MSDLRHSFFSRKLTDTETRYSTFDRELLAVVAALRHFRFLLEGRSFHVLTDHKPLVYALHRARDAWSARQGRHLAYVAEFTSDLRHVAGADNIVADCLSRPPVELSPPGDGSTGASPAVAAAAAVVSATQQGPIRWEELACDQLTCQETQELLTSNTGLLVELMVYQGAQLWCNTSTRAIRPLVPATQRRAIFQQVHELSPAGQRATRRLVAAASSGQDWQQMWWPGARSVLPATVPR